ncbi:hypothetical protein DUNSADRAFT_11758, partial [Dunaliella salina]
MSEESHARLSLASGESDEVKVIAPQTLLISGANGPERKFCEAPAAYTISSPHARASVSPSQTSVFDLPPGGVDAATRKLHDELHALRALKQARLARGNPTAAPNGNAASNPSKRRGSVCYDGSQIFEEPMNGNRDSLLDNNMRASPSPSPPFTASSSGLDAAGLAAPAARQAPGSRTIVAPVHASSSEIAPSGPTLTPAPITPQPLHQPESQRQFSQPPEAASSNASPQATEAADRSEDLTYEQWCMQSEQLAPVDEPAGNLTAQAPAAGDKRVRLSTNHRPSDTSAHELSGLQVGDGSFGQHHALRDDDESVAPQASPPVVRFAPDHRASPSLPFPPRGPAPQSLSQGVDGQDSARQTTSESQVVPPPENQAHSTHQPTAGLAPQRTLARIASTGRVGARGQRMGVRFAGASDNDESSSNSSENMGMAQQRPTMLFLRNSRPTPPTQFPRDTRQPTPANSEQLSRKGSGTGVRALQRSFSTNSKSARDLSRKDSTLSMEGSGELLKSPAPKAKDTRRSGTSGSGFHRKSLSDLVRTITHMGRKSAASETVTGVSNQGWERSSDNSASSTNQGSSDESDEGTSSAMLDTQSGMEERAKEGGHKKKNKKKGKGGASRLVHHSRKSIDAMRSVLHLGGHSSGSSGNLYTQKHEKHNFLSRSMANLNALMHAQHESLKKELENVQDGPIFSSSRPKPRASIDTFRSKAL